MVKYNPIVTAFRSEQGKLRYKIEWRRPGHTFWIFTEDEKRAEPLIQVVRFRQDNDSAIKALETHSGLIAEIVEDVREEVISRRMLPAAAKALWTSLSKHSLEDDVEGKVVLALQKLDSLANHAAAIDAANILREIIGRQPIQPDGFPSE